MIFFIEMPLVSYLERKNIPKVRIILWGALCMSIGFFMLLSNVWVGMLVINMLFLTFGEMFNFPFSNAFAMGRAPRGQEGRYMALYTMTFSLAHICSAKTGMGIISKWDYNANWIFMGCAALASATGIIILYNMIQKENT